MSGIISTETMQDTGLDRALEYAVIQISSVSEDECMQKRMQILVRRDVDLFRDRLPHPGSPFQRR